MIAGAKAPPICLKCIIKYGNGKDVEVGLRGTGTIGGVAAGRHGMEVELKGGDDMQVKLIGIRKLNNETQSLLAKLIGRDLRTYQNKEAGKTQFTANEMFTIAEHYKKAIDDIFLPSNFMNQEVDKQKRGEA